MAGNFYPPPSSSPPFNSVNPRPLYPLREPPVSLLLYPPVLPNESQSKRSTAISDDFGLSTHVVPASYPRVTPFVTLPAPVQADLDAIHSEAGKATLSKDERKTRVKRVTEEILDLKSRHMRDEEGLLPDEREDRVLWTVATRYYRRGPKKRNGKKSITLLLLHANGLHKETWEPFLRHLISLIESSKDGNGSVSVDEIWALDATQHGDAALINRDKLGVVYDWQDHSRDILNFLTRYLPSPTPDSFGQELLVHLPRVPRDVEEWRLKEGFVGSDDERTLLAIGHSLGGATVTFAAITHPRLFTALVLVDPVIIPPYINRTAGIDALTLGAVQRRHKWASREEARRLLASSPFFAAWDPDVLDVYVQFAIGPAPDGGVELKMPGVQEATVFAEARTAYEVFEHLKGLDPRVRLHWVMAGKGSWITGSEEATRDLVRRRPVNSTNTQIASSEHLIVQQAPKELAREVHAYLGRLISDLEASRKTLSRL